LVKMDAFVRKVRAALRYPIFVLGALILVFQMMIFLILPRFEKMYLGIVPEPPTLTQALLDMGEAYAENLMIFGVLGAFMIALLTFWLSNESGKYVWDVIKLRWPLLGQVVRLAAMARLLRTVGMQLRHRIPAVEALPMGAEAAANRRTADAAREAADNIERGTSFAEALRRDPIFGEAIVRMIASGEQAGTLDVLMVAAADYFDTLLMQRVNTVTFMVNPVLTALVGLGIAGILIAAFLPVFELSGKVN